MDRRPLHRVLDEPHPLEPVLVAPVLVAEFSADVSQDHGVWHHPLRYERLRLDTTDADVPLLDEPP
ncbi:hypothetical protein AB0I86_26770 [Streptomyces sp. NPDC049950]|uniref:hypothetical protein n=1 Tax=Streptomyces sp. NPDC049950 TaxID=3156659 RepID=UPI00341ED6FB